MLCLMNISTQIITECSACGFARFFFSEAWRSLNLSTFIYDMTYGMHVDRELDSIFDTLI